MRQGRVTLLLAMVLMGACHPREESTGDILVAPVATAVVGSHRFTETVEGFGVIAALPEAEHVVTPLYTGRVARVVAQLGERVTSGQPLCEIRLDPMGVADLERLQRAVALAERTLARQRRAVEAGVSPRVALEQAELESANARAEYAARTHDYDPTSQFLTLRAPIAGLVTFADVRVGEQVDVTTKAMTVVAPSALAAHVRIDAESSARVHLGQAAVLVVGDARLVAATVLRTAPVIDPTSQRADVWLRTESDMLPPGMHVRATVDVDTTDGLAVPRSALVKTDHGYRVFVLDGGIAHARDVTVGRFDGELAEVRNGLVAGEQVASGGAQELADGMRVTVQDGGA